MLLELTKLTANPDLQVRENVYDFGVVEDYAESMKIGATFPPIVCFFDGSVYWIADGFHRFAAASQAHVDAVEVDVRQGTKRDAILYAVGANADNGLRRNHADKRNAVMKLLNDAEWSLWPQTKIAMACHVSRQLVSKVASEHPELSCHDSKIKEVVRGNGTTYTINTANIGISPNKRIESEPIIRSTPVNHPTNDIPARAPVPLPTWALDEPNESGDDESDDYESAINCGSCRFYKPDSRSDQFYCLSLERIYDYGGDKMPCGGKEYAEFQLGYCECCGQQLP